MRDITVQITSFWILVMMAGSISTAQSPSHPHLAMPHLNIQYTANLDALTDMGALCNTLAATLVALRGEDGASPLFPGRRHAGHGLAGAALRRGRRQARPRLYLPEPADHAGPQRGAQKARRRRAAGRASAHLDKVFAQHPVGMTLQIDEAAPVYEGKRNNLAAHLS
jgi:5-carboxymethyl-2-hydroxymuconate isomerase